jgi:hypothetical protein
MVRKLSMKIDENTGAHKLISILEEDEYKTNFFKQKEQDHLRLQMEIEIEECKEKAKFEKQKALEEVRDSFLAEINDMSGTIILIINRGTFS